MLLKYHRRFIVKHKFLPKSEYALGWSKLSCLLTTESLYMVQTQELCSLLLSSFFSTVPPSTLQPALSVFMPPMFRFVRVFVRWYGCGGGGGGGVCGYFDIFL